MASGQFLLAENLTKINLYRTVAGSVVNVLLNVILIPLWGIVGAALAALVAYLVSTFSIFIFQESREEGSFLVKSISPIWVLRFYRERSGLRRGGL